MKTLYVFVFMNASAHNAGKRNFVALESAKCCLCLVQDDDHF